MTDQPFKWIRANRVYIVYHDGTKENVATCETQEGVERECDRLNLRAWRESKPESALSEPLVFEDAGDLVEAIERIVDRMYGPENLDLERLAA